ncbi:MAG: hypothetical protein K6E20_05710 [Acholeplasmatales bacterium]|nr:hypothetical protein [Acholeplasmatales bacterium]
MYCKKCGNYIANGIDKCPMCGWVLGEEVIEEVKKEEVVEKKPLAKGKLIVEILSLFLVVLSIVFVSSLKFFSKDGDAVETMLYVLNHGKETYIISCGNKVSDWFRYSSLDGLKNFILFKVIIYYISLIGSIVITVFSARNILLLIKKNEVKISSLGFSLLIYGLTNIIYINTSNTRAIGIFLTALIAIVSCIIALKVKSNEEDLPKKVFSFSCVSVVLIFAFVIVSQLCLFVYGEEDITLTEYVFYSNARKIEYDTNTLGVPASVILLIFTVFLSVLPCILISMKKESKINPISYVSVGFTFVSLVVSFFSIVLYNKKGSEKIAISPMFIVAYALALVATILLTMAFIINYKENQKKKIYNL